MKIRELVWLKRMTSKTVPAQRHGWASLTRRAGTDSEMLKLSEKSVVNIISNVK